MDKYRAYSPLFLYTTFAISYGLAFASITATIDLGTHMDLHPTSSLHDVTDSR